jgi:hypothetical protein
LLLGAQSQAIVVEQARSLECSRRAGRRRTDGSAPPRWRRDRSRIAPGL